VSVGLTLGLDPPTLGVVLLTLVFTFLSGYNGSAAIVATVVASGAVTRRKAVALATAAELIGPLVLGVAVAETIARDIVPPGTISAAVLTAALLAAIAWALLASWLGLPMSSTHAIVGGLVGAGLSARGLAGVRWDGIGGVVAALLLTPALGLLAGFVAMRLLLAVGVYLTPAVNGYLRRGQVLTATLVALSHGTNEAQKGMGLILAGLIVAGRGPAAGSGLPAWVQVACALAIAAGVAAGGQRMLRTLGGQIFKIRPVHGFAVQASSAAIVIGSTLLGGPTSMTQVATSAIFGVGAAERVGKVRWEVGRGILLAWLVTLPSVAALAAALYQLARLASL
jgi:PiT family inorganic phosphate transporter